MKSTAADWQFVSHGSAHRDAWNAFVATSRNANFLFDRGFMDYHADRFEDCSLLIHENGRLVALLPAHRLGRQCVSHGGLTYGGLLLGPRLGAATVLRLMQALLGHLATQGFESLVYKAMPSIYHQRPCQEDLYALFRCGAELTRRDCVSVIGPRPQDWPPRLRKRITGATRQTPGLWIGDDDDWAGYWALLTEQLQLRHGVQPVHSLAEIQTLVGRFGSRIRLRSLRLQGTLLAGVVLFDTGTVLRAQYSAVTEAGRRGDLLYLLFESCIAQAQQAGQWFDFGNSNEDDGRHLNEGLVFFKESLGATSIVQDFYRLTCRPWPDTALPRED